MSDESEVGYAKMAKRLGEDYLRSAAWQRPAERRPWTGEDEFTYPPELMTSGACIAELQRRVADVENLAANLAMQISVMQTDLLGVQTANAYLERRVSELQFAADAHGG